MRCPPDQLHLGSSRSGSHRRRGVAPTGRATAGSAVAADGRRRRSRLAGCVRGHGPQVSHRFGEQAWPACRPAGLVGPPVRSRCGGPTQGAACELPPGWRAVVEVELPGTARHAADAGIVRQVSASSGGAGWPMMRLSLAAPIMDLPRDPHLRPSQPCAGLVCPDLRQRAVGSNEFVLSADEKPGIQLCAASTRLNHQPGRETFRHVCSLSPRGRHTHRLRYSLERKGQPSVDQTNTQGRIGRHSDVFHGAASSYRLHRVYNGVTNVVKTLAPSCKVHP